ncbi:hypothetical protein GH714_023374 [Hevea brasiliensis]|uniref:Protein FAR1-RELATED SEQUENCE n=1 Tax=Hevea brasiliensis TaxID=3981 RepID=A0A6A6LML7_HEVBR|nr:hypothetical protein GH714_023374 [Hevea brasiliensis]
MLPHYLNLTWLNHSSQLQSTPNKLTGHDHSSGNSNLTRRALSLSATSKGQKIGGKTAGRHRDSPARRIQSYPAMAEAPCGIEQVPDVELIEHQKEKDGETTDLHGENGMPEERKEFVPPAVGMEFESYDDAYNYYNCYAKEVGFRVRVKNSWFKRNSREKYGAVLCCSSQGFKRIKDVNRLRKETRTGCPAMIRMRAFENVFWIDARSRAACGYFSDVIYIDNTYLSSKYEIPLVALVGINHHGQSVLLGCGLLAGETTESYIWMFKTWLTCLSGCAPQTIITDRCKVLQSAIAEAFPRSHHCFGLSHIMRRVPEKLGGLLNYDAIRKALIKAVYETLKVIEFEAAWVFMVQRFGVVDHEWLRSLYEDRVRWAPVYLKDTFFAGMSAALPGETLNPFFDRYVHKQTPLKEFLDKYELALQKKHKEETNADIESRSSGPMLKTRCSFELQLSKLYTREIFKKFQFEVEEMYSCFSTTQIHVDGPIIIFLVKERVMSEGNRREIRDYEVLYNRSAGEEIPSKYILSRWKKDYKRLYIPDHGSSRVDATDRVQWFNQLYRSALQVVEEGVISLDHYGVALQAFEESLNRVHETDEASLNTKPIRDDDDADEFEIEGDCGITEYVGQTGAIQGENPIPPAFGMEFES